MKILRQITTILTYVLAVANAMAQPFCEVTKYSADNGLMGHHITQMVQDKTGMIWIASWNGLFRFDGEEFVSFKSEAGDGSQMPSDRIRNIWLQDDGNILCTIDEEEYYVFNTKTCQFIKTEKVKQRLRSNFYIAKHKVYTFKDKHGTLWTLYNNGKIEYLDESEGKWRNYSLPSLSGNMKSCFRDRQDNVWAIMEEELYKLTFGTNPTKPLYETEGLHIKHLFTDKSNRCWVTDKNEKKIIIYDVKGRILGYLSPSGRISKTPCSFGASVYTVFQSSDGTIWLGSKPRGLFRLKEKDCNTFSVEPFTGLTETGIYDIREDSRKRLWIATLGGGIICISNTESPHPVVVGPLNGMRHYPEHFRRVRHLLITKEDILLAATTEGLLIADISKEDPENTVFLRHTRDANDKESLSCNATMFLCQDHKGHVYICTESGGICMIKSERLTEKKLRFQHYNSKNLLPTDVTLSAVPFSDKILITGNHTIMLLEPEKNRCEVYDNSFLRREATFSEAAPILLNTGEWLFATENGAFTIRKENIFKSAFQPHIAIVSATIENNAERYDVTHLDTLVLNSKERNTSIRFAALDYTPGKALYAFRCTKKGEEQTPWIKLGKDHTVTLLDMDPGEYLLEVSATNSEGVWCQQTRNLTIIVTPKWYETTTARVVFALLALATLAIIVLTIRYIRKLKTRQSATLNEYLALLAKTKEHEVTAAEKKKEDIVSVLSPDDEAFMQNIIKYVDENISNAELSIIDLAQAAAVSRSGLQRKMKQLMGITPLDFIREARITRAATLLAQTQMPVSEVAYECGFSDPKYFSKCFKASKGKSPKEYREKGE